MAVAQAILLAAAFLTFFDRSQLPPLLPVVAADFDVPVASIAAGLTAHVATYAAGQLLWSVVSSRLGRVRVLALSGALGALANLATALAPDPVTLGIARALAGLAFGATVPAILVYFGDTLRMRERSVAAANLAAALSLGMTVGTLAAALAGEWLHWRAVFAGAAVVGGVVVVLLLRLPEPAGSAPQRLFPAIGRVARNPWALLVLGLALLEGVVLVGMLNFLPASLVLEGVPVVVAGAATAAFGVAVIIWAQLVRVLIVRWPPWVLMLTGGSAAVAAYALLVVQISLPTGLVATVLLGYGWASAHTSLQTWMTDAVIDARPVGMALFATALFGGGAVGTAIGGAAADGDAYPAAFAVALVVAALFTGGAALGRRRYRLREQ
jgi:predicted MFS family arabinose efflux permease